MVLAAIFFLTVHAKAQLKVQSDGKVVVSNNLGILTGTSAISHPFQIGTPTLVNPSISSLGADLRLGVYGTSTPWAYLQARDNTGSQIGMVIRTTKLGGSLVDAITISSTGKVGIGVSNPQFLLDVNGAIQVVATTYQSDERLKENITNLTGALPALFALRGVTYNLKAKEIKPASENKADTSITQSSLATDDIDTKRLHMGFLAQEMREVFPQLVYEDDNGMLSVDYVSLIPVLVEAIKEQQIKIDALSAQLTSQGNTFKSAEVSTSNVGSDGLTATLTQNAPNPFNVSTLIAYYIPANTQNAMINIYNMNGLQIKSIAISQTGKGDITIRSSELQPGMYFYTLVANGKEVDTKRMILTN